MAFKTEDGSGVIAANAYGTVAGFNAYFADRPEDVSALADATIEDLLVSATRYIDTRFRHRFKGQRQFPGGLTSRAVLTFSGQPANDETVTFGSNTYTFKTTADEDVETEVEIGDTTRDTMNNLIDAIGTVDSDDYQGSHLADADVNAITVYATNDGTAATTTASNLAWDQATSYGTSYKKQPLEFPRTLIYDDDGVAVSGIPDKLKEATYEYAFRANSTSLAPDPIIDATGRTIVKKNNIVGPVDVSKTFAGGEAVRITKPFPTADRLLGEYLSGGGGVIRA